MPCPDPCCDKGWIILTEPIVTSDPITGRRVAVIWRLPCMQCTNNVASCCDNAGSQQPEPASTRGLRAGPSCRFSRSGFSGPPEAGGTVFLMASKELDG